MQNLKLTLLYLGLSLGPSTWACDELYLDRKDVSLQINRDLDIDEEYSLAAPIKMTNPDTVALLHRAVQKSQFPPNQAINKLIRKKFKTHRSIELRQIPALNHEFRKAFFVQYPLNSSDFYSFILYLDTSCLIN